MSEQHSAMGKWMLIFAWVAGLALLVVVFDDQLEEQFNPNRKPISSTLQGVSEVQLKQNRNGHYVSNGLVNNEAVVFLLDTGATHVSVPLHLAKRLNLTAGALYPVQTALIVGAALAAKNQTAASSKRLRNERFWPTYARCY